MIDNTIPESKKRRPSFAAKKAIRFYHVDATGEICLSYNAVQKAVTRKKKVDKDFFVQVNVIEYSLKDAKDILYSFIRDAALDISSATSITPLKF